MVTLSRVDKRKGDSQVKLALLSAEKIYPSKNKLGVKFLQINYRTNRYSI